jgi:hypothetical protein
MICPYEALQRPPAGPVSSNPVPAGHGQAPGILDAMTTGTTEATTP